MHFPRYWAKAGHKAPDDKGELVEMACWRWSDTSLAEAQAMAVTAAKALVEKFIKDGRPPNSYGYADRPLREPVLSELQGSDGRVVGAITRNGHGCEVLNTTEAMFIDVDFEEEGRRSIFDNVIALFKKKQPEVPELVRIEAFLAAHPDWGMRVYRTAAGMRILVTHAPIKVDSVEVEKVFEALGADPLYRRLCTLQESYRARLTPKAYRCGVDSPETEWPFADAAAEQAFEHWQGGYTRACEPHMVCKLMHTLGNPTVHPEIQPVIDLHDKATGVGNDLPLA